MLHSAHKVVTPGLDHWAEPMAVYSRWLAAGEEYQEELAPWGGQERPYGIEAAGWRDKESATTLEIPARGRHPRCIRQ